MPRVTTFILRDGDLDRVLAELGELGFRFDPVRPRTATRLDTFDGRLHRAGLRLVVHEGEAPVIELGGAGGVPARTDVGSPPRSARDLPPGPLRSRIAAITEERALLPRLRVCAACRGAVAADGDGRVIGRVELHELRTLEAVPAVTAVDVATVADAVPTATVEVHAVLGAPKTARRAGRALTQLGLEPVDGDTLDVAARVAAVDPGGYDASPTVPLDPAMPAVEGVRDVLANLAGAIEANWQGTVDHLDPEFLHDLRVAVRRTRSVLGQTRAALPPAIVATARDGFAWLGNLTGPARDLDVYLIEWDGYVRPLGSAAAVALDPVRQRLQRRQAAAHADLDEALTSSAAGDLLAWWRAQLAELPSRPPQGERATRELGRLVRTRIERAQARLLDHGRAIGPDSPGEQVHDLRKDAKKLRYLLECFGSLLDDAPRKRFVRRLKAFQDNLGAHQDAEVHVALVREVAAELHTDGAPADTLLAIGQLAERLEQIRATARSEFAERFGAYDTKATRRALSATLRGLGR